MAEIILENKDWIFSGVGVFVLTVTIKLLTGKKVKDIKSNTANIKGNSNTIKQETSLSKKNLTNIKGDDNKINQG
ncbi:MAG: hypothetical protein AAF738_06030 [Bacteroidota bacterium]